VGGRKEGRGERWGERGRGTATGLEAGCYVEQARVEEERYLGLAGRGVGGVRASRQPNIEPMTQIG